MSPCGRGAHAAPAARWWALAPCSLLALGAAGERVAAVGDSLTLGIGSSDAAVQPPLGRARSYPAVLARSVPGAVRVLNFGLPGATMLRATNLPYLGSEEWQAALGSRPDVVLLMLGTNDAKEANWNETAFRADAAALIQALTALPSAPSLHLLAPPPLYRDRVYGMSQQVINEVLPSILPDIAAASGVKFSRVVFDALGGLELECQKCFFEPGHTNDGCHATDYGYEQMAGAACGLLQEEGIECPVSSTLSAPRLAVAAVALALVVACTALVSPARCAGCRVAPPESPALYENDHL